MADSIITQEATPSNDTIQEESESVSERKVTISSTLDILEDFPSIGKRKEIVMEIIVVSVFTLLSFVLAMIYLSGPLAAGVDGGYYELQTYTFIHEGKLYYESPFLSFLFTALFSLISGSTTFGVYFSASLFLAAAVVTNYFAARITWNRKVAVLSLPFSALSILLLRPSTDLIKNLLALVFIPLAIAYFNDFHRKKSWKSFSLSLVFSALTVASHLMASLVLSVCLASYFVIYNIITILEEKKLEWKKHLFSAAILAASAAVMGLVWVINEFAIPVKDTYWDYSSNEIPDGNSGYVPSEEGLIYPLSSFFVNLPTFELILMIFGLVFAVVTLAVTKSKKERNGILMLYSMLFATLLLAVSIDVEGWIWRMQMDAASFVILCGAFTSSYFCIGLERIVKWLDRKIKNVNLSKMKPKISLSVFFVFILIFPLIFGHIFVGKSFNPIISPAEAEDLTTMRGQLPQNDCLIYARHGLEYWTTFFSGYQSKKLGASMANVQEIFQLLDVDDPSTYLLTTTNNPFIPVIPTGNSSYVGEAFTLNGPLNDSVHSSPVMVSCYTPPTSSTFDVRFRLMDFFSRTIIVEDQLNYQTLPSGGRNWSYLLPPTLPKSSYILILIGSYFLLPGQPLNEIIHTVFHVGEPMFKTVYFGRIFAVIRNNLNFMLPTPPPGNNPQQGGKPPNNNFQKRDDPTKVNILTFMLTIRFPFLTDYLHYYFVIPLTVAYWSLLLFSTYKLVGIIIAKSKKE